MRTYQNPPRTRDRAAVSLPVEELRHMLTGWTIYAEASACGAGTVANYRRAGEKLLWFLRERGYRTCGPRELEAFFAYLYTGHLEEGGRWEDGTKRHLRGITATRPYAALDAATVKYYYARLRTWFNWIVSRGALTASPLAALPVPRVRQDQIQPFTGDQVRALIDAAKKSRQPDRNLALVYFLYDTGARASETVGLTIGALDLKSWRCRVEGKGDRDRTLQFSARTADALWALVGRRKRETPEELRRPVFVTQRGQGDFRALTAVGLTQVIRVLGRQAGIEAVRCSPHTFRHSFAVAFLKNGGSAFALKELLGHRSLAQTNQYVLLAEADIEQAHRNFSPVAHLFR